MESLKSPAMIVSSVSLLGVLGASAYFYKKIDSLEDELSKFSDVTERMAKRMHNDDDNKAQLEAIREALKAHASHIEGTQQILEEFRKTSMENSRHIKAILDALENADIDVEIKKKRTPKKKEETESEEEDSDEDYLNKLKKKKKR